MNLSIKGWHLLVVVISCFWVFPASAEFPNLPKRDAPRPITTEGIPHIQIDVDAVPELSAELLNRVSELPGVTLRGTVVGRSGSTGFWLNDDVNMVHPDAIIRGREFAHLHPDGSLHASLPPQLAIEAIKAGWAILHPWATSKRGLEGFVMIYTPGTKEELEVVLQLTLESFRYITGNSRKRHD